jgi:hypothetical protein
MTAHVKAGGVSATVLVIDDQPLFATSIRQRLAADLGPNVHILDAPRPRDVHFVSEAGAATHAIVDLAFGPVDLDRSEIGPEHENGVDGVLAVKAVAPAAQILIVTAFDASFVVEASRAIRQTWPEAPFVAKQERTLADRIVSFVIGDRVQDNYELAALIGPTRPLPPHAIRQAVQRCGSPRSVSRLLLHLAELSDQPRRIEPIGAALGWKSQHTKNVVRLLPTIVATDYGPIYDGVGLDWWRWARPRRGLLRHLLLDLTPPAGKATH